jgi:hypothetical protein
LISQRIKISIPPKRAIRPILNRIVRFGRPTWLPEILAGSGLGIADARCANRSRTEFVPSKANCLRRETSAPNRKF